MNQKLLQNIITSELESLTHKELKQIARLIHCKLGDFYDSKEEWEETREY